VSILGRPNSEKDVVFILTGLKKFEPHYCSIDQKLLLHRPKTIAPLTKNFKWDQNVMLHFLQAFWDNFLACPIFCVLWI